MSTVYVSGWAEIILCMDLDLKALPTVFYCLQRTNGGYAIT